ncbi:hypothetical protein TRFO_10290 [Tritrichomonas foetus]|uniref:Uncharacterized protein n=1 Tax=Tritrichomonas foetus TaxID=1144522 RepID=A0A1J4JCA1_9EUKA|nr:hypothetical protein TRFO_10290 [Tritrichomonas foetus]|eukprot:OHS95879.1 hypothetical protein TRFO_10290 [Tritrichomonas foetus]
MINSFLRKLFFVCVVISYRNLNSIKTFRIYMVKFLSTNKLQNLHSILLKNILEGTLSRYPHKNCTSFHQIKKYLAFIFHFLMGDPFSLTTLSSAVPYIQCCDDSSITPRKIFKPKNKFSVTMPIRPPPLDKSLSPRIRCKSPFSPVGNSRPALDDITLRYIEDPDNNVPSDVDDCRHILYQLQKLLEYFLADYNYNECTMIKKCIIKIEMEIFKLENELNSSSSDIKSDCEQIIDKYMTYWDSKYAEYLDFCKNENGRLEEHQKRELEDFDAAFPTTIERTPKPIKPTKGKRAPRPLSYSLRPVNKPRIFPDRITDLKKLSANDKKADAAQQKQIQLAKTRRERLIDLQKSKINTFVDFNNQTRATFIQIKKSVVNNFLDMMHEITGDC